MFFGRCLFMNLIVFLVEISRKLRVILMSAEHVLLLEFLDFVPFMLLSDPQLVVDDIDFVFL